jgi:hypothetical protein
MLTSYTNIKPDQVHIKYDLTWIIFLNSVCTQSLLWSQQHTIKSIKARSISCKKSSPSGLWLCPVDKQNWQSSSRKKFENARLDYHHYPFHVVLPTPEAAYHIDAHEHNKLIAATLVRPNMVWGRASSSTIAMHDSLVWKWTSLQKKQQEFQQSYLRTKQLIIITLSKFPQVCKLLNHKPRILWYRWRCAAELYGIACKYGAQFFYGRKGTYCHLILHTTRPAVIPSSSQVRFGVEHQLHVSRQPGCKMYWTFYHLHHRWHPLS